MKITCGFVKEILRKKIKLKFNHIYCNTHIFWIKHCHFAGLLLRSILYCNQHQQLLHMAVAPMHSFQYICAFDWLHLTLTTYQGCKKTTQKTHPVFFKVHLKKQ